MKNKTKVNDGDIYFTIGFKSENGFRFDIGVAPFEDDDYYLAFSNQAVDCELLQKLFELTKDYYFKACKTLLIDKLIMKSKTLVIEGYATEDIEESVDEEGKYCIRIKNPDEDTSGIHFTIGLENLTISDIEKERFAFLVEEGYIEFSPEGLIAMGYKPKMYVLGDKKRPGLVVL